MTTINPLELVCREFVELVTDYLSGALTPETRARFLHHLGECPPCTAYLAQVEATRALTGALAAPTGTDAAQPLLEVFRRWQGK
jgi:anti-sigma factor RsiW